MGSFEWGSEDGVSMRNFVRKGSFIIFILAWLKKERKSGIKALKMCISCHSSFLKAFNKNLTFMRKDRKKHLVVDLAFCAKIMLKKVN